MNHQYYSSITTSLLRKYRIGENGKVDVSSSSTSTIYNHDSACCAPGWQRWTDENSTPPHTKPMTLSLSLSLSPTLSPRPRSMVCLTGAQPVSVVEPHRSTTTPQRPRGKSRPSRGGGGGELVPGNIARRTAVEVRRWWVGDAGQGRDWGE